jgi:hypothetical protein
LGGLGTTPRNYGVINFDHRLVFPICHVAANMALPDEPTTPLTRLRKVQRGDDAFERSPVIFGTGRNQDFPVLRLRQRRFRGLLTIV